MTQGTLFDVSAVAWNPRLDSHRLVPWCRWPASGRAVEALTLELGPRAARSLIVTPFEGYHGGYRPLAVARG